MMAYWLAVLPLGVLWVEILSVSEPSHRVARGWKTRTGAAVIAERAVRNV